MRIGTGEFVYEVSAQWARLPAGWSFGEVTGVAVDSRDRVYVLSRGEHPVTIFDRHGDFQAAWGEGVFRRPHGIHIGPDDAVYCADDVDHTVRKFGPDGQVLFTLGTRDRPSDTGYDGEDLLSIRRGGPPFNRPTSIALGPTGVIYVTDGYGNARVHKFSPDGQHLLSWGEPGTGPNQFHLPHGVAVDRAGMVYVGDRQNNRIQIFSPQGELINTWHDVARPNDMQFDATGNLYVAELGHQLGWMPMFVLRPDGRGGTSFEQSKPTPDVRNAPSRVSVFSPEGRLLARLCGDDACAPGGFFAAHGICVDSRRDVYVGEVVISASGNTAPPGCHVLQKLVRA